MVGYATPPKVVSVGDGTYSVTRAAKTGFTLHTEKLKAQAMDEATRFCADQGKQLKVVNVTEVRPPFFLRDIAKVTVVFKALDAGDPELKSPSTPTIVTEGATPYTTITQPAPVAVVERPAPVVERPVTTDELYGELTKLDELRKKGILTDDEFQAEKKKILNRSK
jgi:hypothetical protein